MSILRSERYNPGSVYNNMPPMPSSLHGDAWDARPSTDSLRRGQHPLQSHYSAQDAAAAEYGEDANGYKYNPGGVGYGTSPMAVPTLAHDGQHVPGAGEGQHMSPPQYGHERGASYASSGGGRYDDAYGDGGRGYSQHEGQHRNQHQQQYNEEQYHHQQQQHQQQTYPQQGYEGYGASARYPYAQDHQQQQHQQQGYNQYR